MRDVGKGCWHLASNLISMKILLLDADGLTLKKLGYFSERIGRENNIPHEEITSFYKNEFRFCQQGKADLKEELAKYLPKWKWNKSTEAFLLYWFTTDAMADEEVFKEIRKLRSLGIKCYLASDQEKYRAEYLLTKLDFKNRLDGCFFSCDLGFQKSQSEYFLQVIQKLGVQPSDLMYWDDEQKNVEVALRVGIDARLYDNLKQFKKEIKIIL